MKHLNEKLKHRDPERWASFDALSVNDLLPHPCFTLVNGGIEPWEKIIDDNAIPQKTGKKKKAEGKTTKARTSKVDESSDETVEVEVALISEKQPKMKSSSSKTKKKEELQHGADDEEAEELEIELTTPKKKTRSATTTTITATIGNNTTIKIQQQKRKNKNGMRYGVNIDGGE